MSRIISIVLAAAIAIAAAIVVSHAIRAPDPVSPASRMAPSPAPLAAAAVPDAERGDFAATLDDVSVVDLLERLVLLDSTGALQDHQLVALIERDLAVAVRSAAPLSNRSVRDMTLQRLADFAAGIDVRAALAGAEALADDARRPYEHGVFAAWAAIDPAAVLDYLAGNAAALRAAAVDWKPLAQFDARAVLTLTNPYLSESTGFDSIMRAQEAALDVWASRDPRGATAYTAAIVDGQKKAQLAQRVARMYARTDAEAAWRWATSLEPRSTATPGAVIAEVAARDLDLAVTLMLDESSPETIAASALSLLEYELGDGWDRRLAERFVTTGGERADRYLQLLVSRWDHYEAFDWIIVNAPDRQAAFFSGFSRAAANDPSFAGHGFDRLPANLRGDWLIAVGEPLAEAAPQDAAALLAALRGDDAYDAAFVEVVSGLGKADVQQAVRMLEQAPPAVRATAVPRLAAEFARQSTIQAAAWAEHFDDTAVRESAVVAVAAVWGRESGTEAAAWAGRIADDGIRAAAIGAVARGWTATDAPSARSWVMTLPRGPARDAGLGGALVASAHLTGAIDESLVADFSSAAALQTAVSRLIDVAFAHNHQESARALTARFLTDEVLSERARAALARAKELIDRRTGARPPASAASVPPIAAADLLRSAPTRLLDENARHLSAAEAVRRRREAHAVLTRRGYGDDTVDRAAATLAGANRRRFVLEAVERRASFDGYGAFTSAGVLGDPLRYAALLKIAAAWAAHDPAGALAAKSGVPDDLQFFYLREVFDAWARADAESVLRYLQTAEMNAEMIQTIIELRDVILDHPDSAHALTEKLPERYRDILDPARR